MKYLTVRHILLAIIIILAVLYYLEKDRVNMGLHGFKLGIQGYTVMSKDKATKVSEFKARRRQIKPPKGEEEIVETFKNLGIDVTVIDSK